VSDSQIDKIARIAEKISAENNRRTRQTHTIKNLLEERQQVLVSMCELAELEAAEVPAETVIHNLRHFNQRLVDYTALGHFEIYDNSFRIHFLHENERNSAAEIESDRYKQHGENGC